MPRKDECIVDERKVVDYLLNTLRMPAAAKARFFFSCGFQAETWWELAEALKSHAQSNEVLNKVRSDYGMKYEIEGPLRCPDGRFPVVRTVWQIDQDGLAPRLITAYPVT